MDLALCPCCGSKAEMKTYRNVEPWKARVQCTGCGLRTKKYTADEVATSEEVARCFWNLRKENSSLKMLNECPFCHSKSALRIITGIEVDKTAYGDNYAVRCSACDGGCGATSGFVRTEKEAVELWNKASLL